MSYITFENINKCFDNNHVLKDIQLEVKEGELVTLLGPSGCGKSTLLRCLAGLETVNSGIISLNHEDITNKPVETREIGMVFQQYSLFPNMTVEKNIAFGLKMKKLPKPIIKEKTDHIIKIVHLEGKEKHLPSQLSGGQQQRVALARALVTQPKVLLLDEPLSAIDAQLRRVLQTEIKKLQRQFNMTTLFVTHDQDEAMIMSDRIHLFHAGKIEQSGSPIELYTHPRTKFAASFMGHYNIIEASALNKSESCSFQKETIAIRPEVIQISAQPMPKQDNTITLKGKVVDFISRGNILRYRIATEQGIILKADVLFRTHSLFKEEQVVCLDIEKRNCIELDE